MEWKQLKYHEGQFYVSTAGDVKNKWTGNILQGDVNNAGYERVGMYHQRKKIRKFRHRLVASAFIPNPSNHEFVNHIDRDKTNNHVSNLEWVSQSDNELHAFKTGLKESAARPVKVLFMNNESFEFDSIAECSRELDVSETTIHNWINGGSKSYKNHLIKCLTTIPW